MARPKFVHIGPRRIERYAALLGDAYPAVEAAAERAREKFAGRAIWNVSSTMRGGGVAEMLGSMLPYSRGAGIDTRWVVLRERAEFFEITKRLHNNLHGDPGDGGPLGSRERELYAGTLGETSRHLAPLLQSDDVVFLHDPQTAGLTHAVRTAGATPIWRCHIGADRPDEFVRRAWEFLLPDVEAAAAYVFSRPAYVWEGLDAERSWVMAPAIDPLSPKNEDLDPATVEEILGTIGLGPNRPADAPDFIRGDGTPARVERSAEIVQETRLPAGAPVVAQVSRWDRLKDHRGLLSCFGRHLAGADEDLHLVLAGPQTGAIADDPEGAAVWRDVGRAWRELPDPVRRRAHLVSLPMVVLDENAAMVNALQRRADVVVQKSLAEGFGLTVAEAMWKRRPVVGTRVGGIQDQIVDGRSGRLVDDPGDLEELSDAVLGLIRDRGKAGAIGRQAHDRVFERFLAPRRLAEYADLLAALPAPARTR